METMQSDPNAAERFALEQEMKSGVSWFYWVAALTLVNAGLILANAGFGFAIGLGITELITLIAKDIGPQAQTLAIGLDVIVVAIIGFLGYLGMQKQTWAIMLGMLLLAADTALLVWLDAGGQIISILFHAYALFQIFRGYQACKNLQALSHVGYRV